MKQRKGFTLIEILIVVTIIGLLASVVLVGLAPAQRRGRDTRRLSDIKGVQNALELYYSQNGKYPSNGSGGALQWSELQTILVGANIGVNQVPDDPTATQHYEYATNDGGTSYVLKATLEQDTAASHNGLTDIPNGITGVDCSASSNPHFYCTSI